MNSRDKFNKLKEDLARMGSVIVAFSGGVDSTFLLKAASISCPDRVLAITGLSDSLPGEEHDFAKKIAADIGVEHRTIMTEEMKNSEYVKNPPDRCYYCKDELFGRLKKIAVEEGIPDVLDGTNADDAGDWRPGSRAAREKGVRSPLLDAGLSKDEIRELSKELGLPTWDKPATPCLSSRFPYGQQITTGALERVSSAETFIRRFGITELRVRSQADTARIEIPPEEFHLLMEGNRRTETVAYLKSIGFKFVTLDLQGFRSGSSNELLDEKTMKNREKQSA